MNKNKFLFSLCLLLPISLGTLSAQQMATVTSNETQHRLGVGANYWVSLSNIDVDDIDDNGFSYLLSYQYRRQLWGIEINGEYFPDRYGKDAWAPEAYLIVGEGLYGAAGIGIINSDGKFEDEPFFALRVGLDVNIFANFYLDIAANYRFNDTAELDEDDTKIDTDTVFLGATLRMAF